MRGVIGLVLLGCSAPRRIEPPQPVIEPQPNVAFDAPEAEDECVEQTQIGALTICGNRYEAPSHGGTYTIRHAHYTIENVGELAETVAIAGLDIVADPDRCAPGLPREGQRRPLAITQMPKHFESGIATLAPGERVDVDLVGKARIDDLLFHVRYHHEARFRVAGESVVVRAGDLYYRHPHRVR